MSTVQAQLGGLSEKVRNADLPADLKEKIIERLDQLEGLVESPTFLPEFDRLNRYIEWVISIPWNKKTEDRLDIVKTKEILDRYHYGLEDIKAKVVEYVSVMKLKEGRNEGDEFMRAPILCFVGLVGTGKTTIAKSIAEAMGREFARIPFGGMGSPLELRGKSRMSSEAEPGKIIKALASTQSRNPVILLDELDRVTDEARSSIMGVLVELLDPEQNSKFVDHYIDYPVNLSEVLFIATANNTHNIATAVLDRIEPINMPSYTDQEKIAIAKMYMFPKILRSSGLPDGSIVMDEEVWAQIVRPLGFDSGMRTLERTITGMVRRVARMMVEGKGQSFVVTTENVKDFLPQD